MRTFFLGTAWPAWFNKTDVPLCIGHNALKRQKTFHRARGPWLLDSGAFTSLAQHGHHPTSPEEYAEAAHRYTDAIGEPVAAAIQDWMCEPAMLKRTGLSIDEHQLRTVANYVTLSYEAPDLPWMPVLQGWEPHDYLRCAELYDSTGLPWRDGLVGVGTVCRRQDTTELLRILSTLQPLHLELHAFGVKIIGLQLAGHLITSADSMAWVTHAAHRPPLPSCTHRSCNSCLDYALMWRQKVVDRPHQELLVA